MVRLCPADQERRFIWGLLPAGIISSCLLCWGLSALVHKQTPPAGQAAAVQEVLRRDKPFRIDVTGGENFWSLRYDSLHSPLVETGDAMSSLKLHVPVRHPIQLILHSSDYVYTLELPDFQLKEIAVPGLEFRMEFEVSEAGRYELLGDHLCGADFEVLRGALIAQSPRQFHAWLRSQDSAPRAGH